MATPYADMKPPPAKSASRFMGGVGTLSFRPSAERIPGTKKYADTYILLLLLLLLLKEVGNARLGESD